MLSIYLLYLKRGRVIEVTEISKEMKEEIDWKILVDKSLAAIYLADENGKALYVNEIVEKTTGYTKEEIYSMPNVFYLAHPEDREKVWEMHKRVSKDSKVFYEMRYITKDNQIRWVRGYVTLINFKGKNYYLGNWIDVTRAKKYEEEIVKKEKFLEVLVDKGIAAVLIIQDGKIVYINKAMEEISGYSREDLIDKNFETIVHPSDFLNIKDKDSGVYVFRIFAKDGTKWVTAKFSKIVANGDGIAINLLDITPIVELKDKLSTSLKQLKLLNKILRHDIANALVPVLLALEERDADLLEKAVDRVKYMTNLIKDVRELERTFEEFKAIRLDEIAKEIAETHGVKFKAEPVTVLANEGIRTIINNLIENATTHGKVEVEVEVTGDDEWGILRVSDKGKGIPDELKEKIFREGFTTSKTGTGLGLHIVKELLKVYGGEIRVYDNVPHGAVFEVKLRRLKNNLKINNL